MRRCSFSFSLAIAGALLVVGCDSSPTHDTTEQASTTVSTSDTTTAVVPPPPPPLAHTQFIRKLDRLCKVGNRATDHRFKPFGDINDSASSMDAYASWLNRVNRYINKWNRQHGFFKLDPAEEKDIRDYQRYIRA